MEEFWDDIKGDGRPTAMEDEIFRSRTHPKYLFKYAVLQLVLLAVHWVVHTYWPEQITWKWGPLSVHGFIFFLELIYIIVPVMRWWNNVFIVTTEKIRNEWGIVHKNSREITLTRIASISEERGLLDRIFGAGTLNFYDAAAVAQPDSAAWNRKNNSYGIQFTDIPRVKHVRELIEKARRAARS